MATPTLVSVTEASTISSSGVTFASGDYTGATTDDALVAFIDIQQQGETVSSPGGSWVEIGQVVGGNGTGSGSGAAIFVLPAGVSKSGSYAFTYPNTPSFQGGQIAVVRGTGLDYGDGQTNGADTTSDITVPGLDAGEADRLGLAVLTSFNESLSVDEGSWTNEGTSNSGFSAVYSQSTGSSSLSGFDTGLTDTSWAGVSVAFWESGGDPEPDDLTVGVSIGNPDVSVVGGETADFKVQSGVVDVTSDGQTVSITAVADLDNAFVILANNRHQGAGPNGSSGNQEADDMGATAYLSDTSTITFGYDGGNGTRVAWTVIEYVGPSGGDNEFVVRGRHELTATSAGTSTATVTTTPTSIDDCVPFISGVMSTDTGNGADNLSARAWLSSTATLNVANQVDAGTTTTRVVVVEFTGSNWSVGHGTLTGQTGDNGDFSLVTGADGTSGSTFDVGDWATAWIASWGYDGDGSNEAIADNWPELRIGDGGGGGDATAEVRYIFHGNHDGSDDDLNVHVLQHDDLSVTRFTSTANAANESTVDITSAGLTDLEQSLITGTGTSSGTGSAYGRGWRNFYLNSLTEAAHWCHRSGNTIAITMDVVDFVGLTSSDATPQADPNSLTVSAVIGSPALTTVPVVAPDDLAVSASVESPSLSTVPVVTPVDRDLVSFRNLINPVDLFIIKKFTAFIGMN